MSRYLQRFPEEAIIRVLRAYLITGDSHRTIQRDILKIPAPSRGGGFITMDILHHFDINARHKGILRSKESYQPTSIMLSTAIAKLTELEALATTAINLECNIPNHSLLLKSYGAITATRKLFCTI